MMPKRRTVQQFYGKIEQRIDAAAKKMPLKRAVILRKKLEQRMRAKRARHYGEG